LGSEIVYVEYSGTYGEEEAVRVLQSISADVTRARVWYGGGIDDRQKSAEILAAGADTVVVGDIFHDIADEEVRIIRRARSDLDEDPSPNDIRRWVRNEVNIESTVVFRYLRTIPSVRSPELLAERYLSLTLGLFFVARTSGSETHRASFRRSLDLVDTIFPDEKQQIESAFGGAGVTWRRYITDIVLPTTTSMTTETPVHHLSFAELSEDI
jgi:phosphoglycerol geranylgeranyltransferase